MGPQLLRGVSGNDTRHHAVRVRPEASVLEVLYTRVGDQPERIMCAEVPLTDPGDWRNWAVRGEPAELLAPTEIFEGADVPVGPSERGQAAERLRQLRDPFVFEESQGALADERRAWVFYSAAGESAICVAELDWEAAVGGR